MNKSATFAYKTTLSKANVKTNRVGGTKWTYHKEKSNITDYLTFLKIQSDIRTSYK